MSDLFRKGYGWLPALKDSDPRVRHAARAMLYGQTAGKTRRYGRVRARSPRMPGALASIDGTEQSDGGRAELLNELATSPDLRRRYRKHIERAYGFTYEDVMRVRSIRGRPTRELAPLRAKIGAAFAEIVEREKAATQRGRRVTRAVLMQLYGLEEQPMKRLLNAGRPVDATSARRVSGAGSEEFEFDAENAELADVEGGADE